MASYLARHEAELGGFKGGVVKPGLLVAIPSILFLLQPDFGSTMIVLLCSLAMTTAAGTRLRYLMYGIGIGSVLMLLLILISPYRMARVMSFLSPWEDASGRGYQLIQSLIAVGNGQMMGTGLGESQQKLFFLPAAHTDFIFAVIAEELGFMGCLAVLMLFVIILWRGLKLAVRLTEDTFSFSLAIGLTMLVSVPAMLNVGVVIGLLPTKGMVLPLVGYGGTSLVSSLVTIGLLLRLGRTAPLPGMRS
jgi:cell division protein FtsW